MHRFQKLYEWMEETKNSLWRNTNENWLYKLLKNGYISTKENKFISFSDNKESGGMDIFGEVNIEFDKDEVISQGAIEIFYEPEFFEEYPEIRQYVTGYSTPEKYYDDKGFSGPEEAHENFELTWEDYIEDFSHEEEFVIKTLKYKPGLIKKVHFSEEPEKKTKELLKKFNIKYDIK